jgi:hypothetical protein
MMVGADYTFDIGNGIHVLCEHMVTAFSDDPFGSDENWQNSAFSINYPIGYLDNVSAIGSYSWDTEQFSQYIAWRRTYDNLALNLGLFYYPEPDIAESIYARPLGGRGYGGQITVMYNH